MTAVKRTFEEKLGAVLVREVAGCRALLSADRLSGGASQETYRIMISTDNGERPLALRRAPGGEAAAVGSDTALGTDQPGLDVEALLMRSARAVGVPEPEVYYVLQSQDGLGAGFVMQWLDGEALGARINRSEKYADLRPRLAYECGRLMARVHSIDLDSTGLRDKLAVVSPEQFVRQTWERYEAFDTPQPMIDYAARWLLANLPSAPAMTLVHNDFRNGNFLVDENNIVALLDWELAHIGDPMRDLGWICVNSWRFGAGDPVGGFGQYEDLFRGYEDVSGQVVDPGQVKFWEVFGSFWWAVGCLGMAEHYRNGPDKTVERPAIGRRSSECQVDCINLIMPATVTPVSAAGETQTIDMPRADELLTSVADFLRADVMPQTRGRTQFLSRVAANSLGIVERELRLGGKARALELADLQALYHSEADLTTLRWRLVEALRDGTQDLDNADLKAYLRNAVVNQLAIDQPGYSGFRTATAGPG